jgi:hypothetical protein
MTNTESVDPYTIQGGELCTVCGLRFFSRSMGGPEICPACDCGFTGQALVEAQRKEIDRLSRIEIKYDNLCQVLNEQAGEIERLRNEFATMEMLHRHAMNQLQRERSALESQETPK